VQNIDVGIYKKLKNRDNFLLKIYDNIFKMGLVFNFRVIMLDILTSILFFFVAVVLVTFWISSTFRIPSDLIFRVYGKLLGYVPD